MSRRQYLRLSIVFSGFFLILSLWISQQDFVLPRGELVKCNVKPNYCLSSKLSLKDLYEIKENNQINFLYVELHDHEKLLALHPFNLPTKIFIDDDNTGTLKDISNLVKIRMLHARDNICIIDSILSNYYHYYCPESAGFPSYKLSNIPHASSGYIQFINPEDKKIVDNLIDQGISTFTNDFFKRLLVAFIIFIILSIFYFILSSLIYFIVYGLPKRKGN